MKIDETISMTRKGTRMQIMSALDLHRLFMMLARKHIMKLILYSTLLLLVIYPWGAILFPEILGSSLMHMVTIVLLSIFISLGFALGIGKYYEEGEKRLNSLIYPVFFLILFCKNTLVPLSFLHIDQKNIKNPWLDNELILKRLELIYSNEDNGSRKISAQLFYEEYGKKIPYKDEKGDYLLYDPSILDKKKFQTNAEMKSKLKDLSNQHLNITKSKLFTALVQISSFLLIVPLAIILNEKYKQKNRLLCRHKSETLGGN